MSKARLNILAADALALCAALPDNLASCAREITVQDGKAPAWVQLMPLGTFKANDDRAPWQLRNPEVVIAASKLPAAIDYDHATQLKNDSRASGWIEELAAKGPNGETGLWGRVSWTGDGETAIASKVYRFFSPTFNFDKSTRVVTRIVGGGLVNNPALAELPALASTQENEVNLAQLAKLLGLPETATLEECTTKLSQLASRATATAALEQRIVAIAAAAGLTIEAAKFGDNEQTAICTRLKAPATTDATEIGKLQSTIDDLQKTVATLSAKASGSEASVVVDQAIKDGKITPAQKAWALDYCAREPAKFGDFIKNQPTILANGRVQPKTPDGKEPALTDEQLTICKLAGVSPTEFAKTLKNTTNVEETV